MPAVNSVVASRHRRLTRLVMLFGRYSNTWQGCNFSVCKLKSLPMDEGSVIMPVPERFEYRSIFKFLIDSGGSVMSRRYNSSTWRYFSLQNRSLGIELVIDLYPFSSSSVRSLLNSGKASNEVQLLL